MLLAPVRPLPYRYRSLEFDLRNVPTPDGDLVQPATQTNEPDESVPCTRTTTTDGSSSAAWPAISI